MINAKYGKKGSDYMPGKMKGKTTVRDVIKAKNEGGGFFNSRLAAIRKANEALDE